MGYFIKARKLGFRLTPFRHLELKYFLRKYRTNIRVVLKTAAVTHDFVYIVNWVQFRFPDCDFERLIHQHYREKYEKGL